MDTAVILIALAGATYYLRRTIMATSEQVVTQLTQVRDALNKVSGETTTLVSEVARLNDLVNDDGTIPDEIVTLVNDIQARVQSIDALVADAPAPAPAPVEPGAPAV
jgi:hypothetical protein